MADLTAWMALPPLAVAAVTALGWVARKAYRWGKRIEAMVKVADYELQHNGGNSMKDSMSRIEVRLEDLTERFDKHIAEGDG